LIQDSIKNTFDRRTKADDIQISNHALKWDSIREEKGNHGKLYNFWMGPYIVDSFQGNNALFLKKTDGTEFPGGPVNGRMLKHYVF